MKKQVIECEFEEYSNASELSDIDKALFLEAKRISQNAYAPYSGFNVGAAVRLEWESYSWYKSREHSLSVRTVCRASRPFFSTLLISKTKN